MSRALIPLALVFLVATPASAQHWKFNPFFTLEQIYNDNVRFGGQGDPDLGPQANADFITRIGMSLPLRREFRKGSFTFTYSPSYEKYRRVEELDHLEHRLSMTINSTPSASTSVDFVTSYVISQDQGPPRDPESDPDLRSDPFLAQRTDRKILTGALILRRDVGARWRVNGALNAHRAEYGVIEDFDPGTSTTSVEDRTGYGASVGAARTFGGDSSLGVNYGYQRFDLENSGPGELHTAGFTIRYGMGRDTSISARLGVFVRELGDPSLVAGSSDGTDDGVQASFQYERDLRRVAVSVGANRRASFEGALSGTATNTTLGLLVRSNRTRRWSWQVSSRYALRVPTDNPDSDLTSIGIGGSLQRDFRDKLGLRFSVDHVNQSGAEPGPGAGQPGVQPDRVDASYSRAMVGLVWHPFGRGD